MSAPHQEMHELTAEVGPVARAMLSAALAVVQARQQRRLTAARAAEAAQRASGERADGPPDRGTGAPSPPPSAERGTVGTPPGSDALRERPFSRRATQETADTMVATPGAAEADTHLRGVVRDAVPALADRVLAEESWPALRASLHHIEAGGGNPRAELVAAAGTRTLDTSKDLCRVLSWRVANQTARTTPPRAEAAAQAQAQSVLHALATDPVGTAHAYADAQLHRDTHPEVASAWDEALRTEHIDPHQVADDATAAAVRLDKAAPTAEHDTNFDEEYLGALHELGVDIDAGRQQLAAPGTRTSGQSPATSPAGRSPAGQVSGRTAFSEGSQQPSSPGNHTPAASETNYKPNAPPAPPPRLTVVKPTPHSRTPVPSRVAERAAAPSVTDQRPRSSRGNRIPAPSGNSWRPASPRRTNNGPPSCDPAWNPPTKPNATGEPGQAGAGNTPARTPRRRPRASPTRGAPSMARRPPQLSSLL